MAAISANTSLSSHNFKVYLGTNGASAFSAAVTLPPDTTVGAEMLAVAVFGFPITFSNNSMAASALLITGEAPETYSNLALKSLFHASNLK